MLSRLIMQSACVVVASVSFVAHAQTAAPGVNWRNNLDAAMVEAAQSNRLVLLHFTTRSCGPCKALDQTVFNQPQVGTALEQHYVPVRIDAEASKAIASHYRIDRVPTEIIVTPDGKAVASPPIPDKPDAFIAQLQNLAQHFRGSQTPSSVGTNQAYAGLPMSGAPTGAAAQAPPQQPIAPQVQTNPYAVAAANPQVHGQATGVYVAPPQQQAAAMSPVTPTAETAPVGTVAAQMPAGATPHSYPSTEAAAASPAVVAAQTIQVKKPEQSDLPAGSPPLCFDGCCPVTLKTLNRWAYGNPQFGAVHRGRTYLFTGAQQREQFLAAPDSYSPVFAGKDPVLLIDSQQTVDGTRSFGYKYGEEFYLFSSKETMEKFRSSSHTYAAGVRQAMSKLDSAGDGVIRR